MRYILTKDFKLIKTDAGLYQNVSGDANIEITDDPKVQGILLKPFQTVTVSGKIYARRVSGGGNCALAVLPFSNFASTETPTETNEGGETNSETETAPVAEPVSEPDNSCHCHKPPANPYDVFDNNFFNGEYKPHFPPPKPPMPPIRQFDEGEDLILRIPKSALDKGQKKFVVELPDRKRG